MGGGGAVFLGGVRAGGFRVKGRHAFEMRGMRFGKLVVVERAATPPGVRSGARWMCQCECGSLVTVTRKSLRRGQTKSCGCAWPWHAHGGASRVSGRMAAEYRVWRGMRARCDIASAAGYADYGGRGVRVCAGWHGSYPAFLADVGEKPSPRHSIDRIDVNGHYSCGHCDECTANGWAANCRWATPIEQMRNTRRSRVLEHDGQRLTLAEWAERTGINRNTIAARLRVGASVADALTRKPARRIDEGV